jgi:hypothetical protein
VMEAVKERMLSRRSFFKAGAAAAAVSTVAAAPRVMAQSTGQMADMTHTLTTDFPTFFGEQQFFMDQKFNWAEHKFNLFELRVNEHTGTHVDAPFHFSEDGTSVDAIPVGRLICPLAVIDIREKASADADAQVTPDDLTAWIAANGDIPAGACVAMNSGWSAKVATPGFRNAFPGFPCGGRGDVGGNRGCGGDCGGYAVPRFRDFAGFCNALRLAADRAVGAGMHGKP